MNLIAWAGKSGIGFRLNKWINLIIAKHFYNKNMKWQATKFRIHVEIFIVDIKYFQFVTEKKIHYVSSVKICINSNSI